MIMMKMRRHVLLLLSSSLLLMLSLLVGPNGMAHAAADDADGTAGGGGNAGAGGGDFFTIVDTNHDGTIDRSEYNLGVTKLQSVLLANADPIPMVGVVGSTTTSKSSSWFHLPSSAGSFWKGFTSGVAMIVATEIGDKTFFIAAVLSMRHDRSAVFCGAILALIIMTILSSCMGLVLPQFLPRQYTHIMGGILFLYFGCKLIYDSRQMEDHKVSEELEEVEEELLHTKSKGKNDDDNYVSHDDDDADVESNNNNNNNNDDNHMTNVDMEDNSNHNNNQLKQKKKKSTTSTTLSKNISSHKKNPSKKQSNNRINHSNHHYNAWMAVALQSLSLTFLAEWGDRSQIATIALAAAKNPYGVTVGGCLGHSMCTGMAVLGGRMLAARISEKVVSFWGGIIFLVFGIHSMFFET